MAEFCLDCYNRCNGMNDSKWRYVLSCEKDLCEECKQYKKVIVVERRWSRTQKLLTEAIENLKNHYK